MEMAAILGELNSNCLAPCAERNTLKNSTDLIQKTTRKAPVYTKPLLDHSDIDISRLNKAQLQDLCRTYPKKLKVTGSCEELRASLLSAVKLLREGNTLPDLLITRKRNAEDAALPCPAAEHNADTQIHIETEDTVQQSQGGLIGLPSALNQVANDLPSRLSSQSKRKKEAKQPSCPNNQHHWSFTRPICVLCQHPKSTDLQVQPQSTAIQPSPKPCLIGLQEQGF
jgi:hypothetical protein